MLLYIYLNASVINLLNYVYFNYLYLDNGKRKYFEWEPNQIEKELLKMHSKTLKLSDSSYVGKFHCLKLTFWSILRGKWICFLDDCNPMRCLPGVLEPKIVVQIDIALHCIKTLFNLGLFGAARD